MTDWHLLQSVVRFSQTNLERYRPHRSKWWYSSASIRRKRWNFNVASAFTLIAFFWTSLSAHGQNTMSEYQVKALFLLNFAKYVDWPSGAMPTPNSPIIIGILGQDNFDHNLTSAVEGKNINGHSIIIKHFSTDDDLNGCAILFISSSAAPQLAEILKRTGQVPILTVGEDESFLQKGGIINFILKEGKIHLAINLRAAQKVKLQISSKLLSVADVVKE
jgi:YfiR/HmsC-like